MVICARQNIDTTFTKLDHILCQAVVELIFILILRVLCLSPSTILPIFHYNLCCAATPYHLFYLMRGKDAVLFIRSSMFIRFFAQNQHTYIIYIPDFSKSISDPNLHDFSRFIQSNYLQPIFYLKKYQYSMCRYSVIYNLTADFIQKKV